MNAVKLLIEGYAKETKSGWIASSATTLIQTGRHNIIVDPGTNRRLLLEKLKTAGLTLQDVDYVFLSHYHLDHILLTALFENAKAFDGTTIYDKDEEIAYEGKLPDTDIKLLPTPGHAPEHTSLVIPTQDKGKVVVAQDVFWWSDKEEQKTDRHSLLAREDPFATDAAALRESREKVLGIADWVIPGHGRMFQNKARR